MNIVSIRECNEYEYEQVQEAVKLALKDIGGLESIVKRNSSVFIKTNLLIKKKPEEMATTHPMVIKAVAQELLELGCDITIGDSPGGPYTVGALKGIYKVCGIEEIARELDVRLNYDTSEIKVENPDGKILKYLTVIKPITECDYVIDLCKLKTHVLATFTGGVKNLFGVIPGISKAEYHMKMPRIEDFSEALVDICEYVKPAITIMDGIIGMEGEGPSGGNPRKVGIVLASKSPYALDAAACKVINLRPDIVPTVKRSMERGLIREDLKDIKVVGCRIEDKLVEGFVIPKAKYKSRSDERMPKFIKNAITPKPVVRVKDCVGCMRCESVCPAKAIDMEKNKPHFNLDKCIRCFCCHELCPQKAIDVKRPLLFKIIR